MRFLLFIFFISTLLSGAQNNYPQDYFSSPLDIPILLSGTFAELRSSHFHAGLDIKTQGREGLNVKSSADGFVSRIKISPYGYGKVIYITHPNGYTSVYAHLQKFAPKIEDFIKKEQYHKESFELELLPKAEDFPIAKNEIIGISGNSGSSGGPHLHFEIRDKNEIAINPLLFGIDVKDNTKPLIKGVYAYPLDEHSFINSQNNTLKLQLIPIESGHFTTKPIDAIGNIGFGIITIDRQDLTANQNGVYNIQTYANGSLCYELDFQQVSFNETKHINGLIDYNHYVTKREHIQKLFSKNIPLGIIKPILNNGVIHVEDNSNTVFKIKVSDYKNNESWVSININGTKNTVGTPLIKETTPHFIKADQDNILQKGNITVNFDKDTFYEDFYIDFDVLNDTLKLHKNTVFASKPFKLTFDVSNYLKEDLNKSYIARLTGSKKYASYISTKREGNTFIANTKILGTYGIASDTIAPKIYPSNFKDNQWLSNYRYLKVKIEDFGSGISNYRATVNDKYILMEYDPKTKTLTHDFNDGIITETKNNLKIIVTDNVGNNSTFEALFYRNQ